LKTALILHSNGRLPMKKIALMAGEDNHGRSRPMPHELQGTTILIAVKIDYPGSKISDVSIGGEKVQVSNEALRTAHGLANSVRSLTGG